jgi:hypothetical protein
VVAHTASVAGGSTIEESLAALYGYPLHRLLAKLYDQVKSGSSVNKENITTTLRLLLLCGFEANERVEYDGDSSTSDDDDDDGEESMNPLALFVGFSPLQILAVTALELEAIGPDLKQSTYGELDAIVSQLGEELVKVGGARVSLEAPTFLQRPRPKTSSRKDSSSELLALSVEASIRTDRASLNVAANEHVLHLLGGRERLNSAQSLYGDLGCVMIDDESRVPRRDDSSNIKDSDAKGGNNDRSCAICGKNFSLLNRKHRCRVSWRHLCDECSSKRILVNGKEYRVSDGQFVRAKAVIEKQDVSRMIAPTASTTKRASSRVGSSGADMAQVRRERLEAEEKANRDSLFGGAMMDQATNFLFGGEEQQQQQNCPDAEVSGLMSSLGETRNALLERGDKLSSLNEKSEKMVSASEDFSKMATELRKNSERGLFW